MIGATKKGKAAAVVRASSAAVSMNRGRPVRECVAMIGWLCRRSALYVVRRHQSEEHADQSAAEHET
jgi:hypothetical protein